ncbi:MAG: L,D-transpeptidase family protein [Alphaproteobacteria bacterium]|nr:L,D-transpeptidase family protein [Alphaproteobacteria bacterium]
MRFPSVRCLTLLLAASLVWGGGAHADAGSTAIAALLQRGGAIALAGRTVETGMLNRVYAARDYRPIWNTERRGELATALAQAPSHGLDPGVFAVPDAGPAATDVLLTDAFVRYAPALGRGLVTMGDVDRDWAIPQPSLDPASVLARALDHGIAATLAELPPQDAEYARLRQAYLRYHVFTQRAAWQPIALKLPLKPGASGPDVVKLRQRLAAEDLVPPGDSSDFDAALAAAVSRFQAAHGLPSDGAVRLATLAALNVTPGARLRTIRLNLERRRAMPRDEAPTRLIVNVPAAAVTLYQDGQKPLTMRAIVGDPNHPTPVLQASIIALLLNPPWIVPTSIAAKEILPLARKDPGYLERNDYTVEGPGGGQLIQRPGPKNALGRIKFELPNRFDVYLHDTPAKALLTRARRALSHGCIRVEHPRDLARRVMAGDREWTMDAIDAAIAAGKTRRVTLPHPIPVFIVYWTAYVDDDGTVEFRNDIYGRDQRLDQALVVHDMAEQLRAPARAGAAARPG